MLDIDEILNFHQSVMRAASQQALFDETWCGPVCQHPSCWQSVLRLERSVPRLFAGLPVRLAVNTGKVDSVMTY